MAELHCTLKDRVIVTPSGCMEWTRGINKRHGYGYLSFKNKKQRAHRVSYELSFGPIPEGMHVCHKCDNRRCINPDHLFLGTDLDNVRDCVSKGRHATGAGMGTSKLTDEQVLAIRGDTRIHRVIAEEYGISRSLVGLIHNRKAWKHLP
jgi:hypothetical protein